jgi:hypothetical protein
MSQVAPAGGHAGALLLAVVVTEFAFSARQDLGRAYRDGCWPRIWPKPASNRRPRDLSQAQIAAPDRDGQLIFYRALPGQTTLARLPALPRTRVGLGSGEFSYRITDEADEALGLPREDPRPPVAVP